jgi:hypothetical protein
MKNFFLYSALIISLLISFPVNAQKKDYVARIGDDVITAEEFRQRFELMPVLSRNRHIDSLKHELLYTLIAENIIAREAEKLEIDKRAAFTDIYSALEKMFVRDALFKEEIENKIKISADELKEGISRVTTELKINIISSADSSEIFGIYNNLLHGASFDSLLILRPEYTDQEEPLSITYGSMEEKHVEDLLYNIIPGNFSEPVRTKDGWFIFFVKNKLKTSGLEFDKIESNAKKVISTRKRIALTLNYMEGILKNLTVTPDTTLFRQFINIFSNQLLPKDTIKAGDNKAAIHLTVKDVDDIKASLGSEALKKIFIPFKKDPVTVNEFLNYFYHCEFRSNAADEKTIAGKLGYELRNFIQVEMMSREGYKRGLDKLPEVQHDLKMWRNNYLSQLYRISIIDSAKVSDDEVIEYYNHLYNTNQLVTTIKTLKFISPDLSLIETALNQLNEGKELKDIAPGLQGARIVETGYVPVTEEGEIGRIAAGMKPGEVYGPVAQGEDFVLFVLVDKRESEINLPATYDEVKETLRNQLINKKLYQLMKDRTVSAAANSSITINEKVLSDLKLTQINMFVFRHMGFGGRIWGVPYSAPFFEWMHDVKNIERVLP